MPSVWLQNTMFGWFYPAPMTGLSQELLRNVDVLTPNETEAAALREFCLPPERPGLFCEEKIRPPECHSDHGKSRCNYLKIIQPQPGRNSHVPGESVDATAPATPFNGGLAVALAPVMGLKRRSGMPMQSGLWRPPALAPKARCRLPWRWRLFYPGLPKKSKVDRISMDFSSKLRSRLWGLALGRNLSPFTRTTRMSKGWQFVISIQPVFKRPPTALTSNVDILHLMKSCRPVTLMPSTWSPGFPTTPPRRSGC